MASAADLITLLYLFALYRFFFALSGLDSGSPFAGMGASREMLLGVLVEPVLMLALLVTALIAGSTNLGVISEIFRQNWGGSATHGGGTYMRCAHLPCLLRWARSPLTTQKQNRNSRKAR